MSAKVDEIHLKESKEDDVCKRWRLLERLYMSVQFDRMKERDK